MNIRDLPNVLLVHHAELKADMPGQIRRIAQFIVQPIPQAQWEAILDHCSFAHMKQHAKQHTPLGGAFWQAGGATFINKGTNGRWQNVLNEALVTAYETKAVTELGEDCAAWLAGPSA